MVRINVRRQPLFTRAKIYIMNGIRILQSQESVILSTPFKIPNKEAMKDLIEISKIKNFENKADEITPLLND